MLRRPLLLVELKICVGVLSLLRALRVLLGAFIERIPALLYPHSLALIFDFLDWINSDSLFRMLFVGDVLVIFFVLMLLISRPRILVLLRTHQTAVVQEHRVIERSEVNSVVRRLLDIGLAQIQTLIFLRFYRWASSTPVRILSTTLVNFVFPVIIRVQATSLGTSVIVVIISTVPLETPMLVILGSIKIYTTKIEKFSGPSTHRYSRSLLIFFPGRLLVLDIGWILADLARRSRLFILSLF